METKPQTPPIHQQSTVVETAADEPAAAESLDNLKKKPDKRCLAIFSIILFSLSTTATGTLFIYA
jgi:hypothetical protein